jgi:glycosyltransferase involved in cell wall biosynthesis
VLRELLLNEVLMKLLFFSGYFPNGADPVRGTFNLQQALALNRYCEVGVVSPIQWFPVKLWHGAGPSAAPYREEVRGLPAWHPRYALTPGIARDLYPAQMAAAVLPHLLRVRREFPFDAILATWAFPDVVVGAMASRLLDVPLLAKVHGSDVNVQSQFPLRRRQIRSAMDRAHRVLAVSGALRERLLELGVPDEKILVHHNGVDSDRFQPRSAAEARRELGLDPAGRHVVYVGYLVEAKALHVLIDAVAGLRKAGTLDFTVHLVGCGPLEGELRARAGSAGVADAVRFQGRRPHDEVPKWMAAADVFCLPSVREGCPNVILEALASGRPVVATRVGGIPELVSERTALLVPPSDAAALGAALRQALGASWDAKELQRSVAGFSWDTSAQALYHAAMEAVAVSHPPAVQPEPRRSGVLE